MSNMPPGNAALVPPASIEIVPGSILTCGDRAWTFDGIDFQPLEVRSDTPINLEYANILTRQAQKK